MRIWTHPEAQAVDALSHLYRILRAHELTVRGCLTEQAAFANIMRELPEILRANRIFV